MALIDVQKISGNQTLSGGTVHVGALNVDPVTTPGVVYSTETFDADSVIQTPITLDFDGIPLDPDTENRISIYADGSYSLQLQTDQGVDFFQAPQEVIIAATTFVALTDTFASYTGNASKPVVVNAGETALEASPTLTGISVNGVTLSTSAGVGNFLNGSGLYVAASGAGDVVGSGTAADNQMTMFDTSVNAIQDAGFSNSSVSTAIALTTTNETAIALINALTLTRQQISVTSTVGLPAGVTKIKIIVVGAGGSGGSGNYNASRVAPGGGAGASGSVTVVQDIDVSSLSTIGIVIGSGGASKAGANNAVGTAGSNGGTTTVTIDSVAITATGGGGGQPGGATGSVGAGTIGDATGGFPIGISDPGSSSRFGANFLYYGHDGPDGSIHDAIGYLATNGVYGRGGRGQYPPHIGYNSDASASVYGKGGNGGLCQDNSTTTVGDSGAGEDGVVFMEYYS